jgi:hypothetical protein
MPTAVVVATGRALSLAGAAGKREGICRQRSRPCAAQGGCSPCRLARTPEDAAHRRTLPRTGPRHRACRSAAVPGVAADPAPSAPL